MSSSRKFLCSANSGRCAHESECCLTFRSLTSRITPNGDVGCLQRSVRLLMCGEDEDLDPGLEVALVAWLGRNDRRVRRNDDFLLFVLVLHSQHLAVDPGDC